MSFSLEDDFDPSKPPDFQDEMTEIHCHNCNGYIRFLLKKSLNGNHVLNCPKCGHEHCRVVKDGKVTDERFDTRNGNSPSFIGTSSVTVRYDLTATNYSPTGYQVVASNSTAYDPYLQQAWFNSTAGTTGGSVTISTM
jgi:hypothetical protein